MMIPTLNVVDQAIDQVQDKMKYFEGKSNALLNGVQQAMGSLSNVTVDPVESVPTLPNAQNANFEPIELPETPDLSIETPKPYALDLDIQQPPTLPQPVEFTGLGFDLPDAPIMANDIQIPSELTNYTPETLDTNIEIGDYAPLTLTGLDTHRNQTVSILVFCLRD